MDTLLNELTELLENDDTNFNQLYHIHTLIKHSKLDNAQKHKACFDTVQHYIKHDDTFDVAMCFAMKCYIEFSRIEGLILLMENLYNKNSLLLCYMYSCLCLASPDIVGDAYMINYRRFFVHAMICMSIRKYAEANHFVKKALAFPQEDMPDYQDMITECRDLFEKSADAMMAESAKK